MNLIEVKHNTMQWEYTTRWRKFMPADDFFNNMGKEGWELVHVCQSEDQMWDTGYLFKRIKQSSSDTSINKPKYWLVRNRDVFEWQALEQNQQVLFISPSKEKVEEWAEANGYVKEGQIGW